MINGFKEIAIGTSSFIVGMAYNSEKQELFVQFKKGMGIYEKVGPDIEKKFLGESEKIDGSIGKMLWTELRADPVKYPYRGVSESEYAAMVGEAA